MLKKIIWNVTLHSPPKKISEPWVIASSNPHLLNGLARYTEFLVLSFEKMRTNEKSQTRIILHSHLLQQLGLRPLDVCSASWLMVQFSQLFNISEWWSHNIYKWFCGCMRLHLIRWTLCQQNKYFRCNKRCNTTTTINNWSIYVRHTDKYYQWLSLSPCTSFYPKK